MSQWNDPVALLNSYGGERIVATAFYTDLPETVTKAEDSMSDDDLKAGYSKDKWSSGPQRILIHSKGFINDLRKVIRVPDTQRSGALSMVPPFKYLIHHREAIKAKLDELEETASRRENSPTTSTDESTDSWQFLRVKYFRCLHDLIQTDLANYLGLELKIRDGDLEEILFEETYHLYRPGDLVLASDTGESQLYQIYSVTGGRALLSTRSELPGAPPHLRGREMRAGTWMDLRIVGFSMGWDGENIGPRIANYDLPYFSGRRLVTDLDLYPIQFHSDGDALRKRLRARGSKLVQCFGHKKYTGTAMPPHQSLQMFLAQPPGTISGSGTDGEGIKSNPSETVRGDVYIDYKALYINYFSTFPPLSLMSRLPGEDAEAIDTLSDGRFWNCSDRDLDSLQTEIFHHKHSHLTRFSKPEGITGDDDRLMLLVGQVPAFVLSSRKWGRLIHPCLFRA